MFYGSRTWSIICITPFVATTFAIVILEAVAFPAPFTCAPELNEMLTVPPFTVAGVLPSTRSLENMRAAMT